MDKADIERSVKIGSLAFKSGIFRDGNHDIQIAIGTSANAFPATILITDRRPVINSNRDFDCAFNFISGRSSAVALLARVLDDLARTLAVWTGGCGANLPDERILDPGNLTRSFASSASFWLSSTFDACTCTRKTSF
jgi:hypothetical protein